MAGRGYYPQLIFCFFPHIDITKKSKENKTSSSRHPPSSRSDSQRKSIRRQAKVDQSGDRPVRGRVDHPTSAGSDVFDEEDSEVVDVKYEDQQRRKK